MQSLSALPQQLPAYSRAFSNDLEYRPTHLTAAAAAAAAYQRGLSMEFDTSAGSGAHCATAPGGVSGPIGLPPHMLAASGGPRAPQRSFSSDMEPRRYPLQRGTPLHLANPPPSRCVLMAPRLDSQQ